MAEDVEKTEDGTGQETPANAGKTYTEADVERMIKDRLEREKRSSEAKRKKEQEDADVKSLAEKEEFKALAAKHEARVRELEPEVERAKRYAETLDTLLKEEMKNVPEYVKELLADRDPVDALGWIAKHRSDFSKKDAPDINGGKKGTQPTREERVKAHADSLKASGGYGGF